VGPLRASGARARLATALVVAHRLSTVTMADRIIVMDTGRGSSHGHGAELVEARPPCVELATTHFLAEADRPVPAGSKTGYEHDACRTKADDMLASAAIAAAVTAVGRRPPAAGPFAVGGVVSDLDHRRLCQEVAARGHRATPTTVGGRRQVDIRSPRIAVRLAWREA
jgi:hypothetical protein